MVQTENKKELRPYQVNAINKVAELLKLGRKRIVFQLATGGGKTVTFAGLIHRYLGKQNNKVLVLVHREELLKQARRTLYNWYDIAAAPITAGITYLPDVQVYVAMVETIANRIRRNPNYLKGVGLVIVDECHIANFKKLYDHFSSAWIIGFTATPIAASKKDPLKNHFEDIVCGIDIPQLISAGSLVKNQTKQITSIDRAALQIKNGEFDDRQMGVVFSGEQPVQKCVAAYLQHSKGKKTLIFNVNIEHSKKVNDTFVAFGLPSRHLDGTASDYERAETLDWFQRTPDAILNNVGLFTTGFDEPSILTIIVNKATKSLPLWLQMTGRGSRPYPGKETFTILDMGGNMSEHGDWSTAHNWTDIFRYPDKPREGGTAPTKSCRGCGQEIHVSVKACPFCGADNSKLLRTDDTPASLEDLVKRRPLVFDIDELIYQHSLKRKANGDPHKDISLLHAIKFKVIVHASRIWKLKQIDDMTADHLMAVYQEAVKQWCEKKDMIYSWWHKNSSRTWLLAELKRVFNYEPLKK